MYRNIVIHRESVAPRQAETNAGPEGLSDVARITASLAALDVDLEALAASGIDAITSPTTQTSYLLRGAQEALRQREERYSLAVSATGCVIWDWDVTTNQVGWVGPVEALFGYRPEEIGPTPKWWKERVHPDDYDGVRDQFYREQEQRLGSSGEQTIKPWAVEYRLRRADGSYAMVHGTYCLCSVSGGQALRIIGTIVDITQRKIDEDRLRRSETHLARAQRLTLLGSFEYDGHSGEVLLSDEAYRIFGVTRGSFEHRVDAIRALIHPADLETVIRLAPLIGSREAGLATQACEFRMIRANGEVWVARRECDPVFDATGAIVGFFGTFQDITKVRAVEQRRRELEVQLLQAQRMESLGTLAGGIAHDLNNTLVPVINLAELIRRKLPEDSADRALLEIVRQSGERARDLVRQILAFSRQQPPDREEIDLEVFIKESMRLIRASVLTTIQIEEQIEAVPPMLADRTQLHQVILNLAANAAQAIGTGTGTITIGLATAEGDAVPSQAGRSSGVWLRLWVSDTGCGMNDDIIKRIFDPFFTTKDVGNGTGLGLSVVHGIVTAHGGSIAVKSRPGNGTRFDIILPGLAIGPADKRTEAAVL